MDRLRLRVATAADAEAVAAILLPSYSELTAEAYPPALMARALASITRPNPSLLASGRYYLVEAESGEPAGCGGWCAHPPGASEPDPHRAHIRHFATHPDWLRRGVGRMLYARCKADARAAGFTRFECWASLNGRASTPRSASAGSSGSRLRCRAASASRRSGWSGPSRPHLGSLSDSHPGESRDP